MFLGNLNEFSVFMQVLMIKNSQVPTINCKKTVINCQTVWQYNMYFLIEPVRCLKEAKYE